MSPEVIKKFHVRSRFQKDVRKGSHNMSLLSYFVSSDRQLFCTGAPGGEYIGLEPNPPRKLRDDCDPVMNGGFIVVLIVFFRNRMR